MLPHEFVAKWSKVNLKESAAAQEHFIDLCRLLDHPTRAEADADGSSFTFEKGAKKNAGGDGFADVWKRGYFGWEYKGRHKSLEAAYQQLLQYREALESSRLLVVCDLDRFEVRTNFTNTVQRIERFATADLTKPEILTILYNVFHDPDKLMPGQAIASITEAAAKEFAQLADRLRERGIEPQRAAHFLTKLIFCLFSEDVGLLPKTHFSNIVQRTVDRPHEFTHYVGELFQAMAMGGTSLLEDIPYFNGNLFADGDVIELTSDELKLVRDAGWYDWTSVEPAIFGTLFERSLDPSKRAQIGAHYTHPDDIRAVVEPVLMEPLRREWEEVRQKVFDLGERQTTARGRSNRRLEQQMHSALLDYLDRLSKVRVLDPACGSGNFLYISMNFLKDMEKEVITFAGNVGLTLPLYQVTPGQLYGLEVSSYACELAQTAIWIGYIQWHHKNGFPVQRNPILHTLDTIRETDSILDLNDPATPREPDWPDADVIVSNPPFLGKGLRSRLSDEYVDALFALYGERVPNSSDLCCYWHEKARAMIEAGRVNRAGLLATQSIRGGTNRRVLERIKATGDIFLAYSDREWILEGASVHVTIAGFDDGSEDHRMLDGQPVAAINSNLTAGLDLTKARRLKENLNVCFMGPSSKAPFDIEPSVAQRMLDAPLNPNGRPNSDVVRPVASAVDLTQTPRNKWTIDFGLLDEARAALYEAPFEYVRANVYPIRTKNRRASYAKLWWRYAEPRPGMRSALHGKTRFIATPAHSKHRIFVWMGSQVLCNQGTLVFARDDDYIFGVLHSKIHEVWARGMGTQLREVESGFRYTPTTTFETFPFPWPLGQRVKAAQFVRAIEAAARELNTLREGWLNPPGATDAYLKLRTLTNLYNARPTWLSKAHERLDRAVLDAYGWPTDISDEDVLENLLNLNLQRARDSSLNGASPVETGDN